MAKGIQYLKPIIAYDGAHLKHVEYQKFKILVQGNSYITIYLKINHYNK
jgi:hypothetical protein